MKMFIIAICFILVACGESSKNVDSQADVVAGGTSAEVSMVILKDGTRCATIIGLYKAGIDCDWSHR